MVRYRCIGYGTTDGNGVATLNRNLSDQSISGYTGQGVGEVDFVASAESPNEINSSSDVSPPYEVLDAKWLYNGGETYSSSTLSVTPNSDGSYTFAPSTDGYVLFRASTSSTSSSVLYGDIGECFEFDLVGSTGTVTLRMNIENGSNRDILKQSSTEWQNGNHIRCKVVDNGVEVYVNGELSRTVSLADTGARMFILRIEASSSVTLKNLVYYPV